jgi:predicted RNase H-like HicB family nuclease
MEKRNIHMPIIVVKERLGKSNKDVYTASTPLFDIASQGDTVEEAVSELKEAVELFLEEPGVPIRINIGVEVFTSTATIDIPEDKNCTIECV